MNPSRLTVVPLSRKWMTSSTWEQECRARKRKSPKSTCLESPQRHEEHMVISDVKGAQTEILSCNCWNNLVVWMRGLDPHQSTVQSLDGCYTNMIRKVQNVTWKDHITNAQLYGDIPPLTEKIKSRRLRLAGHCHRHPELPANKLIVWEPNHGKRKPWAADQDLAEDTDRGLGSQNQGRTSQLHEGQGCVACQASCPTQAALWQKLASPEWVSEWV